MSTLWDQIAECNNPLSDFPITGTVHHRNGPCRGRRDSDSQWGWHRRTGTEEELAASPNKCLICLRYVSSVKQP